LQEWVVELPPLRDRAEDIFAIAQALCDARGSERLDPSQTEAQAVERLLLEPWTTNVRGLAAALGRIAALEPPPALRYRDVQTVLGKRASLRRPFPLTLEAVDAAVEESGGNQSEAARRLGIDRGRLLRKRTKKA
jgi:DNA-binding NtrC family response regulator